MAAGGTKPERTRPASALCGVHGVQLRGGEGRFHRKPVEVHSEPVLYGRVGSVGQRATLLVLDVHTEVLVVDHTADHERMPEPQHEAGVIFRRCWAVLEQQLVHLVRELPMHRADMENEEEQ